MSKETTKVENKIDIPAADETGNKQEPKKSTPKVKTGEVISDKKLNVRSEPNLQGKVLTTIPVGDTVKILPAAPMGDWYKVQTKEGVTGFCMKKFIAVK